MCKRIVTALVLAAGMVGLAQPAFAQQTLNFTLGYFAVRGEDARVDDDVLNENRNFLSFDTADFNSATVGAEWLVPIGDYLEGGAGVSFSRRTVPSVYTDFVDNDGTEIDQDLRLRMVPVSFTVRALPFGRQVPVQPYVGAGLGIFNWRYSESGEFIDFSNGGRAIFRDQFVADGNETGAIILAGVRFAGDTVVGGGEVRYHKAEADLNSDFAGSKLDLGGWIYQFTLGYRF